MAKPIRALELHYAMIQFVIIDITEWTLGLGYAQTVPNDNRLGCMNI